jgi:hypothetical protein
VTTPGVSIHERMALVMKDVHGVAKSSFNQHGKYKYAGHEAVTASLRDAYVLRRILRTASVKSFARTTDGTLQLLVSIRWANIDAPSDFVEVDVLGEAPTTTSSGKATGQQAGIAFSYAVKMAELKAFSLTGDDTPNNEDGDRTNEQGEDFLRQFEECQTVQEVEALSIEVRQAGSAVASYRQDLLKARAAAMARVSK